MSCTERNLSCSFFLANHSGVFSSSSSSLFFHFFHFPFILVPLWFWRICVLSPFGLFWAFQTWTKRVEEEEDPVCLLLLGRRKTFGIPNDVLSLIGSKLLHARTTMPMPIPYRQQLASSSSYTAAAALCPLNRPIISLFHSRGSNSDGGGGK